jgi:phospholipid transport system substrate-binding protein
MRTFAALVFLCFAASVPAQSYPGSMGQATTDGGFPADAYYIASPDQIIRRGLDRLDGFLMGSGDADDATVRRFVEFEIAPSFDFAYMARWAAGPMYHRLTPQQRAAMTAKLRRLFLDALARNLGTIERPLPYIEVFPARPGRSMSEAIVYARVLPEQRPPVRLEFRFYWSNEGWKVYDVAANGASAVGFYRSYFTRALRRHGPDVVLR